MGQISYQSKPFDSDNTFELSMYELSSDNKEFNPESHNDVQTDVREENEEISNKIQISGQHRLIMS